MKKLHVLCCFDGAILKGEKMKHFSGQLSSPRYLKCLLWFLLSFGIAQASPIGKWQTIDDQTGEPKSIVTIEEIGGILQGKVTRLLGKNADTNPLCEQCKDDRKAKPVLGMEIIRGLKKVAGADFWEGGEILDPAIGKIYRVKLQTLENDQKLEVKGYWGPFSRSQIWLRTN
jgi:uncharacterized protein (DUF2147 family)